MDNVDNDLSRVTTLQLALTLPGKRQVCASDLQAQYAAHDPCSNEHVPTMLYIALNDEADVAPLRIMIHRPPWDMGRSHDPSYNRLRTNVPPMEWGRSECADQGRPPRLLTWQVK